ncbi:hypothetical protein D3C75_858670 [compost metagenome]
MLDVRPAAIALRLRVDDRLHPLQHLLAYPGVQCTQAQAQQRLLGDDVGGLAGLQGADGDHRGLLRVDVARHHTLQGHDSAGRRQQRVDGQMRHRAVAADTAQAHLKQVLGG